MLNLFKVAMAPSVGEEVVKTLYSGCVTQGPKVDEFENLLREHFGTYYCATVNSCTSAIRLALEIIKRQNNLGPDTEVITTPLTCSATNFPILDVGFKIKWADVSAADCNIDLYDVESKLSENTRILMFVHWGGYPVNLDRVENIKHIYKEKFNQELFVIEDCAHAWNSFYDGRLIGSRQLNSTGNYCCFSFQAIKNVTTCDGGLLITPDEKSYKLVRLLRWFGLDRDNKTDFRNVQDIQYNGYKFHMNDLNATIGIENMKHCGFVNTSKQKAIAKRYNKELAYKSIGQWKNCDPCYWLYTIFVKDRPKFTEYMKSNGIEVSQVHQRNDVFTCLREFKVSLPQLDSFYDSMVCIPCGWWLESKDVDYIIEKVNSYEP